jgi:hypothetical protein
VDEIITYVDVVDETLPRSLDAGDGRLTAEDTVRADLECDSCDLGREAAELKNHGVHGVLQLQHLAFDLDVDGHGEVAGCDGLRDFRDGANLVRQVPGHSLRDPTLAADDTDKPRLRTFTLLVRSAHVPSTSGTRASPPRIPLVPTASATRETSDVTRLSLVTIVLIEPLSSPITPPSMLTVTSCVRSPRAIARHTRATSYTWIWRRASSPTNSSTPWSLAASSGKVFKGATDGTGSVSFESGPVYGSAADESDAAGAGNSPIKVVLDEGARASWSVLRASSSLASAVCIRLEIAVIERKMES